MSQLLRNISYLVFALLLTGCATNSLFMPYPAQLQGYQQQLSQGQSKPPTDLSAKINGEDGILYAQEAGRIAQLNGDFEQSKGYYAAAIRAYNSADFDATISASNLTANASSVLLNDNALPYRGPGFERILVHQYQAFNYLMLGDMEGALVEVRRANELQQMEQARYRKNNAELQAMENGAVTAEMNRLSKSSKATSSFLNAYSYYTTGLLHELSGEPNDAYIDYRKAAQIYPNRYVEQELVRLARSLGMQQYEEFKQKWGEAKTMQAGQGRMVVIYETGFVPAKKEFSVPFRIDGMWQTASMPTYANRNKHAASANIALGSNTRLQAQPISDIDDLAVNALVEEMPAILVRQAARVYAKAETNQWAQRKNDSWGGVAMEIFNIISERADLRSWLTLPSQAQIAQGYVEAGSYPLQINAKLAETIEIKSGQTTLVWAIQTGSHLRVFSKTL
ncbi:COG3014 family protein [Paraferrimonas haliotis]|uniref:Tetratricopeptide repeat protein n=1 Tax=Paraferrimonas haliotis TaxID=2013866 RepID=A0AA37WY65_9GAMM|nr:hypothetical protein [Paraferrimonas haliotis]GLS83345.1 hypothetical protein GCM10007894_13220 [Paraferrimonas haliotis]